MRSGAVPVVLWAVACGGQDAAPDANVQTSFQATSQVGASGHLHVLTIMCADLGSGDVRYVTSEAAEHTHALTMTRAELGVLADGQTVTKSITDQGHTHVWTLTTPATAC